MNDVCLRCWGLGGCVCKSGMEDDGLTVPGECLHSEWVSTNWLRAQGKPDRRWAFTLEELLAINAITQLEHGSSGAAPGLHSRSRKAIILMRKEGWETVRLELEWVEVVFLLSSLYRPGERVAVGSLETKLMKYWGVGERLQVRELMERTSNGGGREGFLTYIRRLMADALIAAARRVKRESV